MLDILQSVSRAVLAVLTGAMLLFGFFFFADGVSNEVKTGVAGEITYGEVWTEIRKMLSAEDTQYIFGAIAAVVAYVLGIINVAGSSLLFNRIWKEAGDDWAFLSRIEALQKPHLLKEALDVLHVKRALVASFFPLLFFGFGLACDQHEWKGAPLFRIASGGVLMIAGCLAPFLAVWLTRSFESIAAKLSHEPRGDAMESARE
jgi:hypothetical protein